MTESQAQAKQWAAQYWRRQAEDLRRQLGEREAELEAVAEQLADAMRALKAQRTYLATITLQHDMGLGDLYVGERGYIVCNIRKTGEQQWTGVDARSYTSPKRAIADNWGDPDVWNLQWTDNS